MNPQSKEPRPASILGILLFLLFVVVIFRLVNPTPQNVVDATASKPVVEEVNTVNNRTATSVDYIVITRKPGGNPLALYKHETATHIIYFTSDGGVWGHPK
jgi:hypothetical protein